MPGRHCSGGLSMHDRLEHGERRGIGRRFGLAGFAEDGSHLGDLSQHPILDLQDLRRLVDRHAGHRGRHVEDRAFVERRHEFLPELRVGNRSVATRSEQRRDEREPAVTQHEIDERPIRPDEKAVHRVLASPA